MNKSSQEVRRYGAPRPSPTASINKVSNFQFMNIGPHAEIDTLTRRNPRNSFYAQKFKKIQCRPSTSLPQSTKRSPITAPVRPEQPRNMAMMGSFFVNTKPNTRRIANSLANYHAELMRRNPSQNSTSNAKHKVSSQRQSPKQASERNITKKQLDIYGDIIGDMHQYLSMIKLSAHKRNQERANATTATATGKGTERRYVSSECKTREIEKVYFHDENLNIKGFQTNPNRLSFNLRKERRNFNQEQEGDRSCEERAVGEKVMTEEMVSPSYEGNPRMIIKYRSTFESAQSPKTNPPQSPSPTKNQSKSPTKKSKYLLEYFGKAKDNTPYEQLQRLKALYYRDLIWKVWFNSGWKVRVDSYTGAAVDSPRYFVGRGNNSKLVKAIMGRRWWWKLESKEDNANFLWTQLKIYSAIQSQTEYEKVTKFQPDDEILQKWSPAQQQPQPEDDQVSKLNENPATKLTLSENIQNCPQEWWGYKNNTEDKNVYLLTYRKYQAWLQYIRNVGNYKREGKSGEGLENRKRLEKGMEVLDRFPEKMTNHLQYSRLIGNKKALYKTLSIYYQLSKKISKFLPMTYHIQNGLEDPEYLKFLNEYYRRSKEENNSMWIVKPGEMSNRGCGIKVCDDVNEIKKILKNKKTHTNGKPFTYIVQEYIRQPFLYQGRKFDIRHYIMLNSTFGRIKGYFYEQGYIRTTSYKYSNKNQDSYIHLTNDAVQKYGKDYGKYEKGNKVSYEDFEKYLKASPQYAEKGFSFYGKILPKIREISIDIMNASYYVIDPRRKGNNFQVFGLDIMIDSDFRPWLIEVNTNPCLELSSPVLSRVIPRMLDNAFAISLDPLFPPPNDINLSSKKNSLPDNYIAQNRFQLVFDQGVQGKKLNALYEGIKDQLSQMEGYGSDEQAYESAEDDCDAEY